ncbi:hypothetical protein AOLI_G00062640 [Acnodon oligacanthus]
MYGCLCLSLRFNRAIERRIEASEDFGLLPAIFPHRQFSTAAAGEESRASRVLKPARYSQVSLIRQWSPWTGINTALDRVSSPVESHS